MQGIGVPADSGNFSFWREAKRANCIFSCQNQHTCTFSQDETFSIKTKRP